MLPFWRRQNSQETSQDSEGSTGTSYSRHKIHPDINSLAKELESSQERADDKAFDKGHLEIDAAGFVGLHPSKRSGQLHKEAHGRDNAGPISDQHSCKEAADGYAEPDVSNAEQDKKESSDDRAIALGHSHSQKFSAESQTTPARSGSAKHRKPSTIMRWATFGRRPDPVMRSASRSTSQSSLSQSQSFVTCLPYTSSSDIYLRTPNSQSGSGHISSPNSHSTPNRNSNQEHDIPSPHTFGMPTPPRSTSKESSSYFTYKEAPPPLPPLDHPAFRDVTNAGLASSNIHSFPVFPGKDEQSVSLDKIRKHTNSLPSIPRITTKTDSADSNTTRPRSKSSAVGESTTSKKDNNLFSSDWSLSKLRGHSRNYSKSSIASSRRSSAEYSARQVSLIGHEETQEDGWEVQVTREMVRLSLGEGEGVRRVDMSGRNARTRQRLGQAVPSSTFGKARGENQSTEGASGLGSPFLLQDTLSNNLTDKQGSNDFIPRARPDSGDRVRSATRENYSRHDMSQGDSRISTTSFSAKNNTRRSGDSRGYGSPSPLGSRSRRGGGRALSNPSPTKTPSPQPPRLDTAPQSASIQSSSLLAPPPTLSVTSPTPEASPISPARRTHHKSTPTLPSTSVLPTPGTPPVIEKSRSSGSGKRKADEAGVGGDKTPPKGQKEPRATFAPEPRTHRASGNSAISGHAPSSFNRSKRVRLTDVSEGRPNSRSGSRGGGSLPTPDDSPPNAKSTGSWSSRGSRGPVSASSHTHGPPVAASASYASGSHPHPPRAPSRRSLSQASIPISALISPHAPSISRTGTFHMRDPRKPSPIQSTPWTLSLPSRVQDDESRWSSTGWVERGGSPLHAWLFFIGFILFPLWWAAALFIPIPETRRLGGSEAEKAVMLDDPQVEYDARSWRTRCRFMAIISVFTYIPFIILVAVFA